MAKPRTTNPPAVKDNALPATTNGKAQQLPLAEGWYSGVIVDLDDSYVTRTTGRNAINFQIKVTGSRRYKDRYLNFIVTDEMQNLNRQDGSSKRQDLIERFGEDVFENPDFFLDLAVRFHIMEQTNPETNETRVGVVSIYPQVIKEA